MIVAQQIETLVQQYIALFDADIFLIGVQIRQGNHIIVSADTDKGITIDQCVSLSRYIEQSLNRDVEDFELEVSSGGLGVPLVIPRQYLKNIGRLIEIADHQSRIIKGRLIQVHTNTDNSLQAVSIEAMVNQPKADGKKGKRKVLTTLVIEAQNIRTAKIQPDFGK